jgi:hypothetical protein
MATESLTQEYLKELFEYRNGELYWKISKNNAIKIGQKAGHTTSEGYLQTKINRKCYLNHRLIFMMFYGYLPKEIDHINNNVLDNSIENLREASRSQNCYNQRTSINNTSGFKNVSWHKNRNKWAVHITINGKKKHIGYFLNIKEAELIAIEVRNKYYGVYARHK